MNEREDERWLDSQLRRVIDGGKPAFDTESWKRKHRDEYEILLARRGRSARILKRPVLKWWAAGLAAAALVILAVGLLLLASIARGPDKPMMPTHPVAGSATEMMSMRSLRMAYDEGGFDALDRQLQNTLDEFGPRSSRVSLQELF